MVKHKHRQKNQQVQRYSNSLLTGLALCLLVFAVYWPVFDAGFVWDDDIFTRMSAVQRINGLVDIWFNPRSLNLEAHYWPVLYSTFWLEHKLWGFSPLGFHIVNLILHSVVVLLIWQLLLRLAPNPSLKLQKAKYTNSIQNSLKIIISAKEWRIAAVFTAAVFAVHPVHVESVAWIIGRKDLLAAAFGLATMLCYLRFITSLQWQYYFMALVVFVLAMLSKSVAVTMPVVLVLMVWWRRGNINSATIWQLLPFFGIAFAITFADWRYYKSIEAISLDYSFIDRILIAARALWFYFGKLLLPTDLVIIYPHWQTGVGDIWGWIAVVTIVASLCLLYYWHKSIGRGALACVLFFAVTLLPVLGFVDYGYMQFTFVADRYQYFASVGIITALVTTTVYFYYQIAKTKWLAGLAVLVLLVLGVLTYQQTKVYHNSISFFQYIATNNPIAKQTHTNLGKYLLAAKQYDPALAAFQLALTQEPNSASSYHNIGTTLQRKGDIAQAINYYHSAMSKDPNYLLSLSNLSQLLASQRQYQESHELLQRILKTYPNHAISHAWLGVVYANTNRMVDALSSLNHAIKLDPTLQEARVNQQKVLAILKSNPHKQ